jgi:hypothetical protein
MIIVLFMLCMRLYAVDIDTPLIAPLDPYAQALTERHAALRELHPEPRTCYDPYCLSRCNRDAARRLFPYEQDAVNTPCQSCYIALRRSGCALDHGVCCTHTTGCATTTTTTVCAAGNWCMFTTSLLVTLGIGIATPWVIKGYKGITKECDTNLSLWRIQQNQFTPTMPVLEELDEPEHAGALIHQ